eukprot:Awhi_evm2s1123
MNNNGPKQPTGKRPLRYSSSSPSTSSQNLLNEDSILSVYDALLIPEAAPEVTVRRKTSLDRKKNNSNNSSKPPPIKTGKKALRHSCSSPIISAPDFLGEDSILSVYDALLIPEAVPEVILRRRTSQDRQQDNITGSGNDSCEFSATKTLKFGPSILSSIVQKTTDSSNSNLNTESNNLAVKPKLKKSKSIPQSDPSNVNATKNEKEKKGLTKTLSNNNSEDFKVSANLKKLLFTDATHFEKPKNDKNINYNNNSKTKNNNINPPPLPKRSSKKSLPNHVPVISENNDCDVDDDDDLGRTITRRKSLRESNNRVNITMNAQNNNSDGASSVDNCYFQSNDNETDNFNITDLESKGSLEKSHSSSSIFRRLSRKKTSDGLDSSENKKKQQTKQNASNNNCSGSNNNHNSSSDNDNYNNSVCGSIDTQLNIDSDIHTLIQNSPAIMNSLSSSTTQDVYADIIIDVNDDQTHEWKAPTIYESDCETIYETEREMDIRIGEEEGMNSERFYNSLEFPVDYDNHNLLRSSILEEAENENIFDSGQLKGHNGDLNSFRTNNRNLLKQKRVKRLNPQQQSKDKFTLEPDVIDVIH